MNEFDDLRQRIGLLNSILDPVRDRIGSEARMIVYRQLWNIVEILNRKLGLGLDNNALDLTVQDDQIAIHFWRGSGGVVETEETILIDRSFSVEKQSRCIGPGSVNLS